MVTTRPPKTIVKPTALGPVANTDTKLLIYGLFQKGRVLAQDGVDAGERWPIWFLDTAGYTSSISSTTGSTFATFATCSNLSFCTDAMNLPFASAKVVK